MKGDNWRVVMLGIGLWLSLEGNLALAGEVGRVALVVGNSAYRELKALPNPQNDATAMAHSLRGLGYRLVGPDGQLTDDPTPVLDLDQKGLLRVVNAFAQAATGQEIAFLYYAGHGFQDGVSSYLVPVDAPMLESALDLEILKGRSMALDKVIRQVDGKAQLLVAVFDACREIPELETAIGLMRGGLSGDGGDYRGLTRVKGGATATSRLIAYAGAAGQLVKDGGGKHSPYTQLLLEQLDTAAKSEKPVELTVFFQQVAWDFKVRQQSQQPLVEAAVKPGAFYLLPGPTTAVPEPAPPPPLAIDYDLKQWESAERCGTVACFQAYLEVKPQGRFVKIAKAQIDNPIPASKPAAPLEPAPSAKEVIEPLDTLASKSAAPVAPPPDSGDAARQARLSLQLAAAQGLLAARKIPAARRALEDAKAWDRQGMVEIFRREQTVLFQKAALAFLERDQRSLAERVVNDLEQWDSQAPEYRALRQRLTSGR